MIRMNFGDTTEGVFRFDLMKDDILYFRFFFLSGQSCSDDSDNVLNVFFSVSSAQASIVLI
jgi:hypothetical protein